LDIEYRVFTVGRDAHLVSYRKFSVLSRDGVPGLNRAR
jgi:hypothetical protein